MALKVWQLDPAQITPFYNLAVCEALAEAGCSVRYFTSQYLYDTTMGESELVKKEMIYFRGLDRQWLLSYPRLRRVLRGLSYPLGHLAFLREARRQRPDIVHIQWSRLPRFDLLLIEQLKAMDIPVVHTVHDTIPLFDLKSGAQPFEAIYSAVDRLVVHTEANKADFLKTFPRIPAERVSIVPMVEYNENDMPAGASQQSAREKLHLPQDAFIVGFFGSIRYYKGLDVLVKAFLEAQQHNSNLHLMIGGKIDPLEKDKVPSEDYLKSLPNVHLFEGFIPTNEAWSYFLAPDVMVLPYRHIYQSAALITAMGFGCPIIATQVGGLAETIDGNGWIVPSEDSSALAEAILEAAANPQRLTEMGQRSTAIIRERHSKAIVARVLMDVYQQTKSADSR